ncbi:MAG: DHH family phosphoesterase [Bacteroides sp.]|nr:DHH family phosphoesterase [Bacteroides sp.]MCM1379770.1 DHH family phosphoesterase [Bacteroides sp.]MCM1445689.1 DHH family phosphoesterase [Prevotella sp.]
MISRIINEKAVKQIRELLEDSERIVITCHLTPDGDAIGSSLGLMHTLSALGKTVTVVTPDMVPKSLMFLPGAKDAVAYTRHPEFAAKLLNEANLIFCLDFNDSKRVDELEGSLLAAKAPKVMVDHHPHPGDFANVKISHPEASSTSILVFRLLCRLELFDRIDCAAAECIYTGMMTDTGNFSYNSNEPDLYIVIAELLKKGIDKDKLYQRACNTFSESSLRLNGYALSQKMELIPEHRCSLISLNAEELERFHYEKGDTEGLVNKPLAMPEIIWSVYLREDPTQIKVSMRSKGDFPVNKICRDLFNGGGHINAAGAEFKGSLNDCMAKLKNAMAEYDKYLPKVK